MANAPFTACGMNPVRLTGGTDLRIALRTSPALPEPDFIAPQLMD